MLLPQLDHADLSQRISFSSGFATGVVTSVGEPNSERTHLSVYRCPSDVGSEIVSTRLSLSLRSLEVGARSNYPGVNGGVFLDGIPLNSQGGSFGENSQLRGQEITDGLSNTFMVGERAWIPFRNTSDGTASLWAGTFSDIPGERHANGLALAVGNCITPLNTPITSISYPLWSGPADATWHGFSSRHGGGAFFGFADGSVRFINDSIEYRTYVIMGTIADGLVFAPP